MAVTVEQPQRTDTPPSPSPEAAEPTRSWLERYQQHLRIGGVSLLLIAAFSVPIMLAPKPAAVPPVASNQPTASIAPANVSITASEFKFNPTSIQVAVGQKDSVCWPGLARRQPATSRSTSQVSLISSAPFRATRTPG